MDFELTEFQAELAEGVRRLCAGQFPLEQVRLPESTERVVDRAGWRQLGDAGVFNLCLAEEAGGVGMGLAEAALVFEELGRALLPGPLVASHLAAGLIDGADDGSVVVGLVERPDPARPEAAGVVPVIIEHLGDLDVLLLLSDAGVASVDPASLDATRLKRQMDPLTPVWVVPGLPEGTPVAGPEIAAWWRRDGAVLTAALQIGMAAVWTAQRATSVRTAMSAHRCLIAWNPPIGRPNCRRCLAYSTASSVVHAAIPIWSAAVSTAPSRLHQAAISGPT